MSIFLEIWKFFFENLQILLESFQFIRKILHEKRITLTPPPITSLSKITTYGKKIKFPRSHCANSLFCCCEIIKNLSHQIKNSNFSNLHISTFFFTNTKNLQTPSLENNTIANVRKTSTRARIAGNFRIVQRAND